MNKVKWIVPGGESGFESTYNGLHTIRYESDDAVLIHDGNRPLITDKDISSLSETYFRWGNAISAIPCVEVLYETEDKITASVRLDRDKVMRTQTPQIYSLCEVLKEYDEAVKKGDMNYASTTELYYKNNKKLYFCRGSEINIKITFPEDLVIFKAIKSQL